MELAKLAEIIQGNIPTRIEADTGQIVETITMQELNYLVNISDDIPAKKSLILKNGDLDRFSLTKEYDVIVGLSSGKSIVIESDRADRLILSNLAIIRIKYLDKVDPYYLCWYINSNTAAINKMLQGTYAVSIIPIKMLKSFQIELLPIEKQKMIGGLYELKRRRDHLTRLIERKKSIVLTHKIFAAFTKEVENGNK